MKSKRNLYFLIPAVLFVWGFIIYRIVDFGEEEAGPSRIMPRSAKVNVVEQQLYQIKNNYPDPFLKNLTSSQSAAIATVPEVPTGIRKNRLKDVATHQIDYKGFIIETGGRAKIALLTIDSTEVFLQENKSFRSYKLLKIYADSVMMQKGDMQFSIAK